MHLTNSVCLANLLYGSDHAKHTQEGRLQKIKVKAQKQERFVQMKNFLLRNNGDNILWFRW